MILFDLSEKMRAQVMNIGQAIENKSSRDDVKNLLSELSFTLENLDDLWNANEECKRRLVSDFIDESIEELQERKRELDTKTLASLANDIPVYGFELKEGRITRKVSDQKLAEQLLTQYVDAKKIHETKLIGIPAMEKLLKEKGMKPPEVEEVVSQFISISHGKPVLAKT